MDAGDDVLDLCCCPGAKLCMLADLMEHQGRLTGKTTTTAIAAAATTTITTTT